MSYYKNQANRLNNLVNDLDNKYKKNQINYKNAVKLVNKYHSNINNLASNAKLKHANKKLAQLNLAVVEKNGSVKLPVREWNKYLNAAENAVEKAINNPTGANIINAQKKLESVEKNQAKINHITNLSPPKGCDDFGFSKATNRSAIMKIYKSSALKYHPNKPGGNANIFKELGRCKDEAIAKLEPIGINNNNKKNNNNNNNNNKKGAMVVKSQNGSKILRGISRIPFGKIPNQFSKIQRQFGPLLAPPRKPNNRPSNAAGNNSGRVVGPLLAPPRKPNNRPSNTAGNPQFFANNLMAQKKALRRTGKLAANQFRKNNPYNNNNKNNKSKAMVVYNSKQKGSSANPKNNKNPSQVMPPPRRVAWY